VLKKVETGVNAGDPFAVLRAGTGSEAIFIFGKMGDCFVASLLAMTASAFFNTLLIMEKHENYRYISVEKNRLDLLIFCAHCLTRPIKMLLSHWKRFQI
jgi:hypothetical protein